MSGTLYNGNGAAKYNVPVPTISSSGTSGQTPRPIIAPGAVPLLDCTFGSTRSDGTIKQGAGGAPGTNLWDVAYPLYIYNGGTQDNLSSNYWSVHRMYPDSDPKCVHVFKPDRLILRGYAGVDGGPATCSPGTITSGIMRFAMPLLPTPPGGLYIEMRAILPPGPFSWPTMWLNEGVQAPNPDGTTYSFTANNLLSWPPEMDIFDNFGYVGVAPGTTIQNNGSITNGNDAAFSVNNVNPTNLWYEPNWATSMQNPPNNGWDFVPPCPPNDIVKNWHTYGCHWHSDGTWDMSFDGRVFLRKVYGWRSYSSISPWPEIIPPIPAHLIVGLQIGPVSFGSTALAGMTDQGGVPNGWQYQIDYVRVWQTGA